MHCSLLLLADFKRKLTYGTKKVSCRFYHKLSSNYFHTPVFNLYLIMNSLLSISSRIWFKYQYLKSDIGICVYIYWPYMSSSGVICVCSNIVVTKIFSVGFVSVSQPLTHLKCNSPTARSNLLCHFPLWVKRNCAKISRAQGRPGGWGAGCGIIAPASCCHQP